MERVTDTEKLQELMLYVAAKLADDPKFGATKLYKVLFYSDFLAYGNTGAPITGASYVRLDNGPVLQDWRLRFEALERNGAAVVSARQYFDYKQRRLIPLRSARLSLFSGEEIAIVDDVIDALRGHTAQFVSELSHLELGGQIASHTEVIPYEAVFLSNEAPTHADRQRALAVAGELDFLSPE